MVGRWTLTWWIMKPLPVSATVTKPAEPVASVACSTPPHEHSRMCLQWLCPTRSFAFISASQYA